VVVRENSSELPITGPASPAQVRALLSEILPKRWDVSGSGATGSAPAHVARSHEDLRSVGARRAVARS
jgi:hypothetical protein